MKMKNAVSFQLSGHFGFFQWAKTRGDFRMTNLFISRTEVLGIIGAIIGLEGYGPRMFKERMGVAGDAPFYDVLGDLAVAVIPLVEPQMFEDHLIHRSMKHINAKGGLQVRMTGLVQPAYKVVLHQGGVSDDVFEKISCYLKNGWAEFIPYFGKNQFPVSYSDVKEEMLTETHNEKQVVDSLYCQEDVSVPPKVVKSKLMRHERFYSEQGKNYSENKDGKIVSTQLIWSSFAVGLTCRTFVTSDNEVVAFL